MKEWEDPEHPVVGTDTVVDRRRGARGEREVVVGEQHALRLARRPRGVRLDGDVVVVALDGVEVGVAEELAEGRTGVRLGTDRDDRLDARLVADLVDEGDEVLYGKYAGTEVTLDGDEYLIMRESDIFGVVED